MKTINTCCLILFIGLISLISSCKKNDDTNPIPAIISVKPSAAIPGDSVLLIGGNFSEKLNDNLVLFGTGQASVKAATSNSLLVTVPENGNDGPITVVVDNAEGTSIADFDVLNELIISSIYPQQAKVDDTIIINGIYFDDTEPTNNILTTNGVPVKISSATVRKLVAIVPSTTQLGRQDIILEARGQTATYSDFIISLAPPFYFSKLATTPVTNTINKVAVINENIAFAVGSSSVVLRTNDGGKNWIQINATQTSTTLRDVFGLDANTIFICGSSGILIKSEDGGNTWVQIDMGTTERLRRITFINSTTGWVVGSGGQIFKTIDGGNSWSKQVSTTTLSLYDVHFIDEHNGLVVGNDGITLKTSDGGLSWNEINSGTTEDLTSVLFRDIQKGWITGENNVLLATVDGGNSWTNQGIVLADGEDDINDITLMRNGNIIAVADDHQIIRSKNDGTDWTVSDKSLDIGIAVEHINGIDSFSDIAIAVGAKGIIIY